MGSHQIGERIRKFRQDAGLSQESLAELVGVSFQQIQKYESGYTTLNVTKLQKIAEALKVSIVDFFKAEPDKSIKLSSDEERLLISFRKIKNSEMRSCILKLVANINKRAT